MSTIYTRATKGSALTWTEGDANITNLNNDKIEDIVEDTTPQLGGNLDVNGNSIVSTSNGNIAITPNGTGNVVLDGLNWPQADGTADYVLKTNGSGQLSWTAMSGGGGDVVSDTTPQLGGDLDVNGFAITTTALTLPVAIKSNYLKIGEASATGIAWLTTAGAQNLYLGPQDMDYSHILINKNANGNISIVPNGTGKIILDGLSWPTADGTTDQVLKTDGAGNLSFVTVSSGGISDVVADTTPQLGGSLDVNGNSIVSTSNGHIVLEPNGFGDVYLNADTIRVGDANSAVTITSNQAGNLTLSTNDSQGGTITINHSSNANISITPSGTGGTVVKNLEYQEFVHALGTTSGTVAPNAANGNVQTITLNGNLTINAFTSPVSGQTITLIINTNGTGRTLTSTMLFAGASKTLSTTNTTDILTMSYIGTTYYASLVKGYA